MLIVNSAAEPYLKPAAERPAVDLAPNARDPADHFALRSVDLIDAARKLSLGWV